jgi:hypothetical protein
LRIPAGASRVRKRPIEIAIGAPSRSAKKELTTVPKNSEPAPKTPKLGCHWVSKMKPRPNLEIAGPAPSTTW